MGIKTPPFVNYPKWTQAMFFGKLRSTIRRMSSYYPPISEAKNMARRKYTGSNKRRKWEFQCAKCKKWFSDKETVVDHIVPAGSLKTFNDLNGFCERLFCSVNGLQVLCKTCHNIKTKEERANTTVTR